MIPSPYLKNIIDALWREDMPPWQNVWVILDGARDQRIYGAVVGSYEEHVCLYGGPLAPDMQLTAPYLVQLSKDSRFTRYLINNGWGKSWGVFLRTNADMKALRTHLKRFLVVKNERGKKLLFRYYDPRVLRVYLPTCVTAELETVFGPVDSYITEGEEPDSLLEFRFRNRQLVEQSVPLAGEAELAAASAVGGE